MDYTGNIPTENIVDESMKTLIDKMTSRQRGRVRFSIADVDESGDLIKKTEDRHPLAGTPLYKSVITTQQDLKNGKEIQQLAFDQDPTRLNYLQSLWIPKPTHVLPDHILKQIAMRDSLVAAILNTRSSQISAFGRELQDRFATGFRIEPRSGIMEDATNQQKEILQKKIEETGKILSTCGSVQGVPYDERMSMSTFLGLQTYSALTFGRFATEILYTREPDGGRKFHSFRPRDASTMYPAAPKKDAVAAIREQAIHLMEKMRDPSEPKLRPEKFENDEYAYVQVLNGKPVQGFTPDEMVIHTIYPSLDIEMRGFPVTPIDTVVDGVATHMNITMHNKLYFQSGRAARGMIVIKSSDVDQGTVAQIRQHFNASINSVSNAWRVPVFGVDPEEAIEWQPFDMAGGRDMEFQYLSDQNAREICSAFQISPEELPGYQHLSRGTNSQALSESSNEYKLEAARDVGIRPLLNQFQDFLNDHILPLIDPMVAQLCTLKLYGLDADTEEKEDTGITTRMPIDLTLDEILERKEKDPIGQEWGGRFIFNPSWQAVLDKYIPVGEIVEHFFGRQGASQQEDLQYIRDPFWFNFQQLKMQADQLQAQAQQAQQPEQPAGAEGDGGGDSEKGKDEEKESELASGADQAIDLMSKSEANLQPNKRKLLALHRKIVKDLMDSWERDSREAVSSIVNTTKNHG